MVRLYRKLLNLLPFKLHEGQSFHRLLLWSLQYQGRVEFYHYTVSVLQRYLDIASFICQTDCDFFYVSYHMRVIIIVSCPGNHHSWYRRFLITLYMYFNTWQVHPQCSGGGVRNQRVQIQWSSFTEKLLSIDQNWGLIYMYCVSIFIGRCTSSICDRKDLHQLQLRIPKNMQRCLLHRNVNDCKYQHDSDQWEMSINGHLWG